MSNKAKGIRYELKAKQELEQKGYVVVKSGGSFGVFDLWAAGDLLMKLIQVKSVKKKKSFNKLKKEILGMKVPKYCEKELWIWISRKGWEKYSL